MAQNQNESEISRKRAYIEGIDFSAQRNFVMQPRPRGQGWNEEQAREIEKWYRRYLTLLVMFPGQNLVPHPAVDKMWHAHIAEDTRQYQRDCNIIFGHFLHHDSGDHEMSKELIDLWYERTQERLREVFGEDYSKLAEFE